MKRAKIRGSGSLNYRFISRTEWVDVILFNLGDQRNVSQYNSRKVRRLVFVDLGMFLAKMASIEKFHL